MAAASRIVCLCGAMTVLAVAVAGCRHRNKSSVPPSPATQPAPAPPAGTYRASRDGVELILDLPPKVRWSAHAIIRVKNEGDAPVFIPRHATSIIHDYQLRVRRENGEHVPTRMRFDPRDPGPPTLLELEPGQSHEQGVQLGMLFALRAGEAYLLTVRVPIQREEKPDQTVALEIAGARFTVVGD
jgi:hypothetical protein